MRRTRQYATPLWSTPPLLSYAPHTRRPTNLSLAQACMRMPVLAGPLLTTVPFLCLEDHPCWDVLQKVCCLVLQLAHYLSNSSITTIVASDKLELDIYLVKSDPICCNKHIRSKPCILIQFWGHGVTIYSRFCFLQLKIWFKMIMIDDSAYSEDRCCLSTN